MNNIWHVNFLINMDGKWEKVYRFGKLFLIY